VNNILFFKPSRIAGAKRILDSTLVRENYKQGVVTTLILDTNVLINIEELFKNRSRGATPGNAGIERILSLTMDSPPGSICISPGLGFQEMPPIRAAYSTRCFEAFCSEHAFLDTSDSIRPDYQGKASDYSFFDIDENAQMLLTIPFCSLVYLQVVDRLQHLRPMDKLKRYLSILEEELDILSGPVIEIARYCFAPHAAANKKTIALRKVLRRNFLKIDNRLPANSTELLRVAFNGACDLTLLNSANVLDSFGLNGIPQDCWVVTGDRKLFQFSEIFHHLPLRGEAGKFFQIANLEEHRGDPYWEESMKILSSLFSMRASRHFERVRDPEKIISMAKRAATVAAELHVN